MYIYLFNDNLIYSIIFLSCQSDIPAFRRRLRMEPWVFEMLLSKIEGSIKREDTNFRKATPTAVRLSLTLRYLTSGDYMTWHIRCEFYS